MNTHDIELPPLPESIFISDHQGGGEYFEAEDMQDYARSAIGPYAKRIAELEAKIEADRKRRGEPVNAGWCEGCTPDDCCGCGPHKPAEPVNLCDCERSHNGLGMGGRECDCPAGQPTHPAEPSGASALHKADSGAQNEIQAPQPAEPVKVPSGLIERLMECADELGCSHADYADTMRRAAKLLSRYGQP